MSAAAAAAAAAAAPTPATSIRKCCPAPSSMLVYCLCSLVALCCSLPSWTLSDIAKRLQAAAEFHPEPHKASQMQMSQMQRAGPRPPDSMLSPPQAEPYYQQKPYPRPQRVSSDACLKMGVGMISDPREHNDRSRRQPLRRHHPSDRRRCRRRPRRSRSCCK